ncbi:hypothetical protein KC361_g23 [Hortaea werneckii]|nr:hypothetical protein KC361_g23 [Hortaea werneckii]
MLVMFPIGFVSRLGCIEHVLLRCHEFRPFMIIADRKWTFVPIPKGKIRLAPQAHASYVPAIQAEGKKYHGVPLFLVQYFPLVRRCRIVFAAVLSQSCEFICKLRERRPTSKTRFPLLVEKSREAALQ